ncbi:MAG: LptF/LptG family permease, partial [Nitrosomonas sp.]
IFNFTRKPDGSEIVFAKQASQIKPTAEEPRPHIQLSDGIVYKLSGTASIDDVIQFENMTYFYDNDFALNYRRKSAATRTLWESDQLRDIAELQWRISRPLATILLALIAMTFIRIAPRQDKTDRTYLVAALVFAAYYNLAGLAKNWVEQGTIGTVPGVWWLELIMLSTLIVYAVLARRKKFSY